MTYLTLSADYNGVVLRDISGTEVSCESLGISKSTCVLLFDWNKKYQEIIPIGMEKRTEPANAQLIEELDNQARQLISIIISELNDVKIRYYSEGLLSYCN
jgi:hypothetical protein